MKKIDTVLIFILFSVALGCNSNSLKEQPVKSEEIKGLDYSNSVSLSQDMLLDKVKGGWAGQVIGCTYGGPTEFRYCGTMIQNYIPIEWDENKMLWYYQNSPGLYDDLYMDLTFVDVFEKEGLDAPALSHAMAFANAEYMLWHANQAARYNILSGMEPPASGYWENNPHSEDIDFQIEADFAGLMSPGMVNAASEICDKVGHIMNYGDGWYGGVYVAAMYSLAFVSDNPEFIVNEGLKAIPEQSDFYKCIADVIAWYKEFPNDWKRNWFEVEKKWSSDIGCADGVFAPFNIDAKINAAYIVIGMLYGHGEYGKSIDISTRCGQDSDCNPANVAGILGTMLGYSNIPAYWKQGLEKVEDMDFKYTTISLNDVYKMGLKHALQVIEKNGGTIKNDSVTIKLQKPITVKFEKGFEGQYPVKKINVDWDENKLDEGRTEYTFKFEGTGFIISGGSNKDVDNKSSDNYIQKCEVYLDNKLLETVDLPTNFTTRRTEITWRYNLKKGTHDVRLKLLNPKKGYHIGLNYAIIYNDALVNYIR